MKPKFTLRSLQLFCIFLLGISFSSKNTDAQVALTFDSSQFVRTGGSPVTGGSARTVEAWIKTGNLGIDPMVIADWGEVGSGKTFTLKLDQGKKISVDIGGSSVTGTTSLNDNAWHHVGVSFDPSVKKGIKLFIDNALETTGRFTATVNTATTTGFRIGAQVDTSNFFKGTIDEVRVYNYARTLAQFTADVQSYCTIPSGLVAYYKLEEGTIRGSNAANTTATDYSGAGNNGVLVNFGLATTSTSNWDSGIVSPPTLATPTISITSSPSGAVCTGASVTYTAVTTLGGSAPTYQWTVNSLAVGTNTPTYSYVPSNGDIVQCTLTSSDPCISAIPVVASKTVMVNAPPVAPTVTTPVLLCQNSTAVALTATGSNLKWYTMSTGGTGASTLIPTTATVASTTYYVSQSLATSAGGCESPRTPITVTVNAQPAAPTVTSPISYCKNETPITLTATGTDLLWYVGAAAGTSTAPTPSTASVGVTNYRVTQTSPIAAGGCESPEATIVVTINALPTITIKPTNPAICLGSSITLTASGASTYSWSPSTYLNTTTGSTVVSTPLTSPNYTVTGTDINGCVSSATKFIALSGVPVVTVSTSKTAVLCAGDSLVLTGNGADTYSWSPATGLSATNTTNVTAIPAATTTYIVTGKVTSTGCTATASKLVTINPLPTAPTVSSPIVYCRNITALPLSATGTNLNWYTVSSGGTSAGSLTPSTATAGSTEYYVSQTSSVSAGGCESPRSAITVTVNPLPTITVNPSNPRVCLGLSVTLTASGASTYSWSPAAYLNTTTGSTVISTPTSSPNYTVTGTDANGCVNSTTKFVALSALPVVSITTSKTPVLCAGDSLKLTGNGADTYTWTPATGLNADTGTMVTANPNATTTYVVTGTVTATGCTDTASETVTVNALPIVTISPAATIIFCGGSGTATLTASGASSYVWSPAAGLSSTTSSSVTATPTISTLYTVKGTDGNGCVNADSRQILVRTNASLQITPVGPTTICDDAVVPLAASSDSLVTFSWTPSTGLSATTGANVLATPHTTTTYTVTGTGLYGCIGSANITITVKPRPTISVVPSGSSAICFGGSISLTASGANTYIWTPSTGLSATNTASVVAKPTVSTSYKIYGTAINGCIDSLTKIITVNPLPLVTILPTASSSICEGSSITLTATGGASYFWSPSTDLSSTTTASVIAAPKSTITYSVLATTALGCQATATKTITVNPAPNATINPTGYIDICQDDTVYFSALPGFVNYDWKLYGVSVQRGSQPTFATFTGGFYTVTVTNGIGCTGTTSAQGIVTVTQHPSPKIKANGTTLDAGTFASYQWYLEGVLIPGATMKTFDASASNGNYTVKVTDTTALHCPGISEGFKVSGVGVNNVPLANQGIRLYPNPTEGLVQVESTKPVSAFVYGMDGKLIWQGINVKEIKLNEFPDGVYRAVIRDLDGAYLGTEKLLKIGR